MNIQFVINLILGIIGLSFAAYVIPSAKLKYSFLIGYACLVFYRLYDPSTSWAGVDWIRHIVVLAGEVSFFIFITNFCKKYIEVEETESVGLGAPATVAATSAPSEPAVLLTENALDSNDSNIRPTIVQVPDVNNSMSLSMDSPAAAPDEAIVPLTQPPQQSNDSEPTQPPRSFGGIILPFTTMGSFTSIYNYGSAEGISHIFLAPTFLAIVAVVFTRIAVYASPFKLIAKLFALSYALGIMLHVGEFFLESHPFVTLSHDNQHNVEMFWYVVSSLVFYFTLYKFNQLLKKTNAQQKTI